MVLLGLLGDARRGRRKDQVMMVMDDSLVIQRYARARAVRLALQEALHQAQRDETHAYSLLKRGQLAEAQERLQANPYRVRVQVRDELAPRSRARARVLPLRSA